MQYLRRFVEWMKSLFWKRELEITIVGLQNAGKTTFVHNVLTGEFDSNTIPTVGYNYNRITKGKIILNLWDLGGQPRFRESWEKYCRDSDVIIFVVDSSDRGNLDVAKTLLHKLLSWPTLKGIPLLVLGNKNDLPGALKADDLIRELYLQFFNERKVACYSISAKYGANIDLVLEWLLEVPQPRPNKPKRDLNKD